MKYICGKLLDRKIGDLLREVQKNIAERKKRKEVKKLESKVILNLSSQACQGEEGKMNKRKEAREAYNKATRRGK